MTGIRLFEEQKIRSYYYILEFTGLDLKTKHDENDLESALIHHERHKDKY